MSLITLNDDIRYSHQKDAALSRITLHTITAFTIIFAVNGFLFDGFESFPVHSDTASLLFAGTAILSAALLYLMKRIKKYPFLFACGSILLFYGSCLIIGIENLTPRFFINSAVVFLAVYIYFIATTGLESPKPENVEPANVREPEDNDLDTTTNISGQVSEGNFWLGFAVVFGKSFLVTMAALSLLFISI